MRIIGSKTITEDLEIDVDPCQIVRDLRHQWMVDVSNTKISDKDPPTFGYINHNGQWEHWENGHGSGYTYDYRKATPEEVAMDSLFHTLETYFYNKRT
jgi:hypothetical protein